MKELLKQLEKYTNNKFAEVKANGSIYFVSTGERIPKEHIIAERSPSTKGFYQLESYICSGKKSGCAIGKPAKDCVANKIINKNCGKYAFNSIGKQVLSLNAIEEIVKFFGGKIE